MSAWIRDRMHRLEPTGLRSDLARGFAAEVADPAWMLGRQWQLGEHQGEDAASPVQVTFRRQVRPLSVDGRAVTVDGATTPPEAMVESEPDEWWTLGRRIRIGQQVAIAAKQHGVAVPTDDPWRIDDPPPPYDVFDGAPDGRALWTSRERLGLEERWFPSQPPDEQPRDTWDPATFAYDADLRAGEVALPLVEHEGGRLDWYHVDAETDGSLPDLDGDAITSHRVLCSRVRYPGAPTPRWWELEQAALDVGGQAPDRAHLATLLLADLLASHSDDRFTFPIDTSGGALVTIDEVTVTDSFGDTWKLAGPSDDWSLFRVAGLPATSMLVWPRVQVPLIGPLRDEVAIGIDEDANLLWAVERRADGREIATPAAELETPGSIDARARIDWRYRPSPPVPEHWHPYVIDEVDGPDGEPRRRFVQARLADHTGPSTTLTPEPVVDLLLDPDARPAAEAGDDAPGRGADPVHQIEPAVVPTDGLRLERRYVLTRRTDGAPVLWSERRRQPAAAPPGFVPRFDVLDHDPAVD